MDDQLSVGDQVVFICESDVAMKILHIEDGEAIVSWLDGRGKLHAREVPVKALRVKPPSTTGGGKSP
jgi:hypothetical protein